MLIEWIGFQYILAQITFWNAAVRRNANVSGEENRKSDKRRRPRAKFEIGHVPLAQHPDHRDLHIDKHHGDAVIALRLQDRHRNRDGDQKKNRSRCGAQARAKLKNFGSAKREHEMEKWQPAKTPTKNSRSGTHAEQEQDQK